MIKPWYLGMLDVEIVAYCQAHDVRALSVRQPYANELLSRRKLEEYRRRPCRVRGPVALYSSQQIADGQSYYGDELGVILGMLSIVGSVEYGERDFGWQVKHPHRFAKVVPVPQGRHPQSAFWRPWPVSREVDRLPALENPRYGVFYREGRDPTARWYGVKHRSRRAARKVAKSVRAGDRHLITVMRLAGIDLDRLPTMAELLDWDKNQLVAENVTRYLERIAK